MAGFRQSVHFDHAPTTSDVRDLGPGNCSRNSLLLCCAFVSDVLGILASRRIEYRNRQKVAQPRRRNVWTICFSGPPLPSVAAGRTSRERLGCQMDMDSWDARILPGWEQDNVLGYLVRSALGWVPNRSFCRRRKRISEFPRHRIVAFIDMLGISDRCWRRTLIASPGAFTP